MLHGIAGKHLHAVGVALSAPFHKAVEYFFKIFAVSWTHFTVFLRFEWVIIRLEKIHG